MQRLCPQPPEVARSKVEPALGLAITTHLAELQGGAIGIDSAPGIGTTVTVTLPATRAVSQDSAG